MNVYETAQDMGHDVRIYTLRQAYEEAKTKKGPKTPLADLFRSLLWFPPSSSYRQLGRDESGRCKLDVRDISCWFALKSPARCIRAAVGTIGMVLLWKLILAPVFGEPHVPARGDYALENYHWVAFLDVVATLFLIFLVVDATLYQREFISRLTRVSTVWPKEISGRYAQRYGVCGACEDALADLIDLQYLARRTRCITQLIYFPFISLAVMVFSRNHLFDDFSTPWTLPAAQAISLAVIVGSVLAYRSAAENARKAAREQLIPRIIAAQPRPKTAKQLQLILNEVESLNDGAFAPLLSQPIVKAVLLPLVTYAGAWLAHLYGLPGV